MQVTAKMVDDAKAPTEMRILVLDHLFRSVVLLDVFESLIWTERYQEAGDFEVYTPINEEILWLNDFVQSQSEKELDTYVYLKGSDQLMIVESMELRTEVETGDRMIMSGRSLESILDRRIIWAQTVLNGKLQNGVQKLLNENAINPSIGDRKIDGLSMILSTDSAVTSLDLRAQYTGDNLYDTVVAICKTYDIGFRIVLNDENQFVFSLYKGTDRSYDQLQNPYVIFSPKFENVINSSYLESNKTLKNVALVAGEDEGTSRRTRTVGSKKGLARRELYVDARDIQSETEEGTQIPEAEYNAQLDQRGSEKLAENIYTKIFEGDIESTKTFVYGRDFFKGDVVQFLNEYGIQAKVRIMEIVRSQDTNGYNMYPTFSVLT